ALAEGNRNGGALSLAAWTEQELVDETVVARGPRTWGWTAGLAPWRAPSGPGPGHGGMDRFSVPPRPRRSTEPHARGDGPRGLRPGGRRVDRAPRTWGWTDFFEGGGALLFPSPTHVGMDRPRSTRANEPRPEPHARGDEVFLRLYAQSSRGVRLLVS